MTNVVWMDGFDVFSSASAPATLRYPGLTNISYNNGRFSPSKAIYYNQSGGSPALFGTISAISSLCVGFAWDPNSNTPGGLRTLCSFNSGSNATANSQCTLGVDATGKLYAYGGNLGSLLGASAVGAVSFLAGNWTYIECEVVVNGSTGSFNAYVNGVQVFSLSGVNTKGFAGTSTVDTVILGNANLSNWGWDDWYIGDAASRLGECRIETLHPSSDNSVTWTPNSGANNWSRVSEAQSDGDTSYVSSSTPGQIDLYGIGALSGTPSSILAAQSITIARKDDVATRQVRSKLKSGATTANGTTQTLGTSYAYYTDLHATDPNTSAAWATAAVNAALIGVEEIT